MVATTVTDCAPAAPGASPGSARTAPAAADTPGVASPCLRSWIATDW